ncbi:MAG: type II toxin-antitoxin system VapC family toxin [Candidatus Dormibacteraeota bacterium]|uniref:Ribonuclease VapC n=1 Tax=Candidatus Amunia macphersoniae TaxID=3127014 RepID=A0A934KMG4_9BACT|nr:type II toxin-antitoxin system VapC family toxin [Candidatus Dormibacteraeota bacterium]
MPVVDASVVVDWVAPDTDPSSPALVTLRRLAAERAPLLAPRLLVEEVANALLTGVRRRRWSGAAADLSCSSLRRLPIRLVDDSGVVERAWDLARRYDDHPIYDMLYVAVAERARTVLITADRQLRSRLHMLEWVIPPDVVDSVGGSA